MSSHHRVAPGVPQAPPPPVLSARTRVPSRRSRSRSPRGQRRFRSNSRERGGRRASRSPPPPPTRFTGPGRSNSRGDSFRKAGSSSRQPPQSGGNGQNSPPHSSRRSQQLLSSRPPSQSSSSHHALPPSSHQHQQSISLVPGDEPARIIRQILDPSEVKLPRRPGEGARPIFERAELKEAMLRRQRLDDNEENPPIPGVPMPEPPQQRVIAIIREPIDSYRVGGYRMKEELPPHPAYSSRRGGVSPPERLSGSKGSSGAPMVGSNYHGRRSRSISPPPQNSLRGGPSLQSPASQLTPQLRRASRERSPMERGSSKRERLYERNDRTERVRGDGDLRDVVGRDERDVARDRIVSAGRSRSREKSDRFGGHSSTLSSRGVDRSRSPVRIARERRSRSRSDTPPPMPPELRRKFIMERDLRSKLSRPLTNSLPKYESEDSRGRGRGGYRGGFSGRGMGARGFTRGFRSRAHEDSRSRGFWEHDLFEKDGVDDDLRGDSKPNRD